MRDGGVTQWLIEVAPDPRGGGQPGRTYTYLAYPGAKPGDAVFAPLGKRETLGWVLTVEKLGPEWADAPMGTLREVRPITDLSLPKPLLELLYGIADDTLTPLPAVVGAAIPPGLRERIETSWELTDKPGEARNLVQAELLRSLRAGGELIEGATKPLEETVAKAVEALRAQGALFPRLRLRPAKERRRKSGLLRLTPDPARQEDFLKNEGARRPAQALVVTLLQEADEALLTPEEIRAMAGVTDATLRGLMETGLLESVDVTRDQPAHAPTPNAAQRIAIGAIERAIQARRNEGFLLFGVTGSGKTEVYLRAIAEAARIGRTALLLVPEIALATQAISALRERFGNAVVVMHSDLPTGERLRNWTRARTGSAGVVVGVRSAVFAPLEDIGVIVMDEEHEPAYKQESQPRYHARAAVERLAAAHDCPFILGSATPSIESFARTLVAEGRDEPGLAVAPLTLLSMPQRVSEAQLPEVTVEDLTLGFRQGQPTILTPPLFEAIGQTLRRREQTILFLNRRAYAPFLVCRDCGHRVECPRCSVSLSWHRRDGRLRCHQCGWHEDPPERCPVCDGERVTPFGLGVEKVEENVRQNFPEARVARLDRDVAQRRGATEEILAGFRAGELDILVGTQMVAKGLHFPNVTLVGVVAADITLNLPDFRASERTFDLLSQVAGRAGRGQKPGRVIVQTFNPGDAAIEMARRHDYVSFFEVALAERRDAGYPPFVRLVNITLASEDRELAVAASAEVARRLDGFDALGPTDCVFERINDRFRRHVMVKLRPGEPLPEIGRRLEGFRPRDVQVVVDVDPYSML